MALESENPEINTPFCFTISISLIITYVYCVVNSTDGLRGNSVVTVVRFSSWRSEKPSNAINSLLWFGQCALVQGKTADYHHLQNLKILTKR